MTKCKHCIPPNGLPIFPVRYVIVPKTKEETTLLPSWAQSPQTEMISTKLSDQSQIALRVMSKGYLYMLLKVQGVSQLIWRVYSIDENGGFWRQHNVDKYGVTSVTDSKGVIGCEAGQHKSGDVAFITIEQAETCEKAWFAYSRFIWNEDICKEYSELANEKIRDERMQRIEPAKWITSPSESNGIAKATENNIQQVLGHQPRDKENDYRYKKFSFFDLNSDTLPSNYSELSSSEKDDVFVVDMDKFRLRSTCQNWNTPWHEIGRSQKKLSLASTIESSKSSDSIQPMMIGIWDGISIVEDIKLWVNQAISNVQQIEMEREREINLVNSFQFLGEAIKNGAANDFIKRIDNRLVNRLSMLNGDERDEYRKIEMGFGGAYFDSVFFRQDIYSDEIAFMKNILNNVKQAVDEKLISEENIVIEDSPFESEQRKSAEYDDSLEKKRREKPQNVQYLQYEASYFYLWTTRNIDDNFFLKPYDKTLFLPIMQLENSAEANFSILSKEFDLFKQKAFNQALADKPVIESKRQAKQQAAWEDYSKHISEERVNQFNTSYATYKKNAEDYIALLINDFILITDARKSRMHPFYYANKEYFKISEDYFDFVDDILLTLNSEITIIKSVESEKDNLQQKSYPSKQSSSLQDYSKADLSKINAFKNKVPLVFDFISEATSEPSNLFWAAILSNKSLTESQAKDCLDYVAYSFQHKAKDLNEEYVNEVINKIAQIFNIADEVFNDEPLKNIETIVEQLKDKQNIGLNSEHVENYTDQPGPTVGDVVDKTVGIANTGGNAYKNIVEYTAAATAPSNVSSIEVDSLLTLLKWGKREVSGFFTSVTTYMHAKGYTLSSRYGIALYSAVCSGMRISATIIRPIINAFVKFSNELIKLVINKTLKIAEIIDSAYQKLGAKLKASYDGKNIKPKIITCLIGFQLFSILRIWREADNRKFTDVELTSVWGSIMSAIMLVMKTTACTIYVNGMISKIKTKAFGAALSSSQKFRLLRTCASGIARIGNVIGAVGALLGLVPQINQGTISSGEKILKYAGVVQSALLAVDFMCQAVVKKTLAKLILAYAYRSIICAVVGRLVLFMLHPLVGLAIFIISTIIMLVTDNALQSWFKSNRLGKNYYLFDETRDLSYTLWNYSFAYGSYQDELNALHKILDTDEYKAEQEREKKELKSQVYRMTMIRG